MLVDSYLTTQTSMNVFFFFLIFNTDALSLVKISSHNNVNIIHVVPVLYTLYTVPLASLGETD